MSTEWSPWALHYSCPLVTSLFLVTRVLRGSPSSPTKKIIQPQSQATVTALIISTYVSQTVLTLATHDLARSQSLLVHLVSLAVVWSAMSLKQPSLKWERAAVSAVTATFELPLFALSLSHNSRQWESLAQNTILLVRLLLFFCVVSTAYRGQQETPGSEKSQNGKDNKEEEQENLDSEKSRDEENDKEEQPEVDDGIWSDLEKIRNLLPYVHPEDTPALRWGLAINVSCLVADRFLNVFVPQQLGKVTNGVLANERPYSSCFILFLGMMLQGVGMRLIRNWTKNPIRRDCTVKLNKAIFDHVMNLSADFHVNKNDSEISLITRQADSLTRLLELFALDFIPICVDLVLACYIFYQKFNALASVLVAGCIIVYTSADLQMSRWNRARIDKITKAAINETTIMGQAIKSWEIVANFNQISNEKARYANAVEASEDRRVEYSYLGATRSSIMQSLRVIVYTCLIAHTMYEIDRGHASAGDLVFFLQYWYVILSPLDALIGYYRFLANDLKRAQKLLALLALKPSVTDKEDAVEFKPGKGEISFHDVEFSYVPERKILKGINMCAKPGQTVALVGSSGSGKTTALRLLTRSYDVTAGRVTIDGQDVRDLTQSSLRDAIGIVAQHHPLLQATVLENVRYARPTATFEEVQEACRKAAIHDRIEAFPDKYDTLVGENGMKLSGGEAQRISIARVFLKNSPIVLLDEATNSLDLETEEIVQDAFERLAKKCTTIVIAHRLTTVQHADCIFVFHEGDLVESGTHDELVAKANGRYQTLWNKQFRGYVKDPDSEPEAKHED